MEKNPRHIGLHTTLTSVQTEGRVETTEDVSPLVVVTTITHRRKGVTLVESKTETLTGRVGRETGTSAG